MPIHETMAAFREQQQAGRVHHMGVSNVSASTLERASAEAPIACVQKEYRPALDQEEVLGGCRQHVLASVAYSPLGVDRSARRVLTEIGKRHPRSWTQVAIRWLVQQEQVATFPRSRTAEHREQNLAAFDFELETEENERISALR